MAKERHGSLETALILIELLRKIPKPPRYTNARELADRLEQSGIERDIRSIQRHLDVLSGFYPIERNESDKPFRYRWMPDAAGLNFPVLSAQESVLLTFAYAQLKNLLPNGLRHYLNSNLGYAQKVLDQYPGHGLDQQWLKKVRVVPDNQPLLPPEVNEQILEAISNALYENRYLDLVYYNAQEQVKEKNHVMPLGLAQQGPRIYLVARFDGYDNQRILALHRIQGAVASEERFEYPADFDLAQYEEEGHFGFSDGQWIKLTFCMEKSVGFHITETPLAEDQVIVEHQDHYEFSMTIRDSKLLDRWLQGWGTKVWDIQKQAIANPDSIQNRTMC